MQPGGQLQHDSGGWYEAGDHQASTTERMLELAREAIGNGLTPFRLSTPIFWTFDKDFTSRERKHGDPLYRPSTSSHYPARKYGQILRDWLKKAGLKRGDE